MPEILKKNGVYTHLVSDHLHYWEDGGATYHNRYSSWEIIRGQEGDHWKGQVERPEIPPVVKIAAKQTGTGESGLWRYDWVNRQYIREEKDFPQTQCFDRGCEFIEKNKDADNWLLQLETFDPHEPFYAPQKYLDLYPEDYKGQPILTGREGGWKRMRRRSATAAVSTRRWSACAITIWAGCWI